ncbi:PREDICTED: secreted Ly-6/uPAR-related protein 1 isoform X2 [Chinchilla lanigera]|uniref:secreted Ly-6/uPAR-related protein 1 isoform X2 n=1 Tax=Chinchilla lanigera TaxID=34839 RepID=UPI0006985617|nr:PREDICTED: secreted Ly-6/uPAR-related protein 1 isoform X2 [Chinchilla lanigera]
MQGIWLALLVLALAAHGELVMALQCYTCHEPTAVSRCITVTECNANDTMCKTTLYSLDIVWTALTLLLQAALLSHTSSATNAQERSYKGWYKSPNGASCSQLLHIRNDLPLGHAATALGSLECALW